MVKEKKAKEVKVSTTKEDKVTALIKGRAYKLYDREPNGSLVDSEVAELSKDIVKLK